MIYLEIACARLSTTIGRGRNLASRKPFTRPVDQARFLHGRLDRDKVNRLQGVTLHHPIMSEATNFGPDSQRLRPQDQRFRAISDDPASFPGCPRLVAKVGDVMSDLRADRADSALSLIRCSLHRQRQQEDERGNQDKEQQSKEIGNPEWGDAFEDGGGGNVAEDALEDEDV